MAEPMSLTFARNIIQMRGLRVRSFMFTPPVYTTNGTAFTMATHPVLQLTYEPSREEMERLGGRPTDATFKVNIRNHTAVCQFFGTMLDWFTNDKYKDLFILDENSGRKLVNMDYRDLAVSINTGNAGEVQAMLAVPAIYNRDAVIKEGAMLCINQSKYAVIITDAEIESLYSILKGFSFQSEALLLVQMALRKEFWTDRYPGSNAPRAPRQQVQW